MNATLNRTTDAFEIIATIQLWEENSTGTRQRHPQAFGWLARQPIHFDNIVVSIRGENYWFLGCFSQIQHTFSHDANR